MEIRKEPKSQGPDWDPTKKPSGALAEKIFGNETSDKGMHGELLRPSEREDSNLPAENQREPSSIRDK